MAAATSQLPRTMNDNDYIFAMERRRKYSEGYREIEEVDASRGELSFLSTREPSSNVVSTQFSPEEREFSQEISLDGWDGGDGGDEDVADAVTFCKGTSKDEASTTSVTHHSWDGDRDDVSRTLPALCHSQSFLDSLPTVTALPETVATQSASSKSVCAVAAQVVRLPSTAPVSHRNAALISIKIFKPSQDWKLGIRLQLSKEGHLQIGRVGGFLAHSPLRCGDELLRLNNQDVSAWTTTKALNYLRDQWGWISMVVRNPQVTAETSICLASVRKRSSTDRLGVSFSRQNMESPMSIRGLNMAGLLGGGTTIRVGDVVESINDIPSTYLNTHEATSMIRSIPDWVHILVRVAPTRFTTLSEPITQNAEVQVAPCDPDNEVLLDTTEAIEIPHLLDFNDRDEMEEPSLLSLTMYKMQKTDKIGLSLVKLNDGIYINKVSGYLAGSILKEGMSLLAINHKLTSRMTLVEATSYLRDRVGSITFLARNPHGNPKYVQAMVYKKSSESTNSNLVGISFKGSPGRQLKICEIRADGLFVESCLNAGDSVLRINETPCRRARPKDAVDLVRGSPAAVSILAKSKSKNGIVIARVGNRGGGGPRSNFVVPRSA